MRNRVSRWSNTYNRGGQTQDVAWRMLPSLHKFPICHRSSRFSRFSSFRDIERGGHAPGYLFYIIDARFKQGSCVFLQISLESRSNRVKYYGFRSVIPFQRFKITKQVFPSRGKCIVLRSIHLESIRKIVIDHELRSQILRSYISDQKTKSFFFRSMKILLYFVAEEIYQKLCSFIDGERYICERGGLI